MKYIRFQQEIPISIAAGIPGKRVFCWEFSFSEPLHAAFIRTQSSVLSFHGRKALRSLNSECCKYIVNLALIAVHGWFGSVDASNQISELLEYSDLLEILLEMVWGVFHLKLT